MVNSIAIGTAPQIKYCWLFDRSTDLLFIFVPTVILFAGFVGFGLQPSSFNFSTLAVILYSVNVFHQGGTYFHFFDRRNREYYTKKENRFNYVFFPLLVGLVGLALSFVSMPLVTAIYIVWSIQHLVQQNMGILLLYHNHKVGEAIVDRTKEVRTIHSAAYLFSAMLFFRTYVKDAFPPIVMQVVVGALTCYFAYSVFVYLADLYAQVRKGAYINAPAVVFWIISLVFMSPLAFFNGSYAVAALVPSFLHWLQYIGINYIMIKRKYRTEENAEYLPTPRALLLFFAFCTLLVVVQFGSITAGTIYSNTANFWNALLYATGFVHYALDGRIWKFRETYNRQNILPYLRA